MISMSLGVLAFFCFCAAKLCYQRVNFPLPLRRFSQAKPLFAKMRRFTLIAKFGPRKNKKPKLRATSNHCKTIGARDPATGRAEHKLA